MLILEARQQRMANTARRELPDRFQLIVEGVVGIILLSQLPPDDLVTADLRARTISIAEEVETAMQI